MTTLPLTTETPSGIDWTTWTPSPTEITAANSGQTYQFWITSRFSIVLQEAIFPKANLSLTCTPENLLGQISNVEPVPPDYYVIRYETTALGQCSIQNGTFRVTIDIVQHP